MLTQDGATRAFAPLLGHVKPADGALARLLRAEGVLPPAWAYDNYDIQRALCALRRAAELAAGNASRSGA